MNDFSTHKAKTQTRAYNIALIKLSRCLWSKSTKKLRCDWAELAGARAPTLTLLREHNLLEPGKFIGIDTNLEALTRCEDVHGQDPSWLWVHDDLFTLIQNNDKRMSNVGVLNYDSMRDGGSPQARTELRLVCEFARHQYGKLGEFLLVANFATRWGWDRALKSVNEVLDDQLGVRLKRGDYVRYPSRAASYDMLHVQVRLGF